MWTHGHSIVVYLPSCIYWNSYRTWRWVESLWVLQYLQATASPAAILRLIGGHRPFLFASTLFGFSIYLPPSSSPIFILRDCRCQKNLPEKKLGTDVPFLFFAFFVIEWPMCNTNFLCLDDIYKKSNYGSYVIFFRVPDQHMRRCMTNPPVSETTINQHSNDQLDIGGCKIYLVIK